MIRYLRLYAYFLRFSFSKALEFRLDFFFRVVMDLLYYAVNLAFYLLIYLHTDLLGGWNREEMMVFVAAYLIVDALNMTFFANNMWWLPIFINRGDLDYYLIRPVSSLFFLSLREFAANSFLNLLIAASIMAWALSRLPSPPEPARLLFFLLLLINGAFLYHLVRLLTIIPVFWLHSGRGFEQIFWNLARFKERPDRIFSGWTRRVLLGILPFGLMTSFPARLFLDPFDPILLLHIIVVTALFFIGVVLFWRRGLRAYSSASS